MPASLDCGAAEVLLVARIAGSISGERERELSEHLEGCAGCVELARELQVSGLSASIAEPGDFTELTTVDAENYLRGAEIGRGGMGHVVRARDRRLGRTVAIKELIDRRMGERFEQEARLTARLQHPAIVSVYEAGRWPSGEAFYAMKYVAGRPLDLVVAGMKELDERVGLLANLIIVVEAIAYAHSEGVIHRDLKPQNILIGPFGETVVIDWGLAKNLRAQRPGETQSDDLGYGFTHGAGTPGYMPPEQARGEPLDERADVYALGATLHHVLAGDLPDGKPLPDTTPPDLRAIVAKATATEKEDRYLTAAELASELKRFQNGQLVSAHRYTSSELVRRWLRRHRAVVALAAASVVVVATIATLSVRRIVEERDRAHHMRDVAESQRHSAERLVDYMLGTLKDRLEPIGKLDVLAGVGKEVEGYFASAPDTSETDVSVLSRRSRALMTLTSVDLAKGNLDDALAEVRRAQKFSELWYALTPTPDAALMLTRVLVYRASAESFRGNSDAAVDSLRQASEVLDRARVMNPKDAGLKRRWGGIQDYLGREYRKRGEMGSARERFRAAIQLLQPMIAEEPGDPLIVDALATTHKDAGDLEEEDGHPQAALDHFDRNAELKSVPGAPGHMDANMRVSWGYAQVGAGAALTLMGDYGLAQARLDQAHDALAQAAAQDPDNVLWQSYFGEYFVAGCETQRALGNLAAAAVACVEAAGRFEKVLEKDPSRENSALELSVAEATVAGIHLVQHDLGSARTEAARAVKLAEEWSRKQPGRPFWQAALCAADLAAAWVARAEGRMADASAAARAAREIAVGPERRGSGVVWALSLGRADLVVADLALGAGDATAAETALREAIATLGPAVEAWPRVVEVPERLAEAQVRLADVTANAAEARLLRERAGEEIDALARRGALGAEFRSLVERAKGR